MRRARSASSMAKAGKKVSKAVAVIRWRAMTDLDANVRAYLEDVHLCVLATTNKDGSAHVAGLWYELRGDTIVMNTGTASRKVRNLKRDARASVIVMESNPPRHVSVEGTVTFDDSQVLDDLVTLASRYAGPEAGPGIAQNIAKIPHISLKLKIEKVRTFGKI
jgi:PPOX class probable F420-dependent enzyme